MIKNIFKKEQSNKKINLVILDENNYEHIINGSDLYIKWSHDLNVMQYAQAAINLGEEVYITKNSLSSNGLAKRATALYPIVNCEDESFIEKEKVTKLITAGQELLLSSKHYKNAKTISFFAAVHMIESPGLHYPKWLYDQTIALRYHTDIIITQNKRMKEIINLHNMLFGSINIEERILITPLGLWDQEKNTNQDYAKKRKELNIDNEICICNAGGIWRWTDYIAFLNGYIGAVRSGASNLKLYITGLTQADNNDHLEHTNSLLNILSKNRDLVGNEIGSKKPIVFIEDWVEGGKVLKNILPAMDIGLNINNSLIEGWQSYRVRVLEYLSNNIPIINTKIDNLSSENPDAGFITVNEGDINDYRSKLICLSKNPETVKNLKKKQEQLIKKLYYRGRFEDLVNKTNKIQSRDDKTPSQNNPCSYDVLAGMGRKELLERVSVISEPIAHQILTNLDNLNG